MKKLSVNEKKDLEGSGAVKVEIDDDGDKCWYDEYGNFHRENGPAIEGANGDKSWLIRGELHNEKGPASIETDGTKEWYLHDEKFTEEEFNKRISFKTEALKGSGAERCSWNVYDDKFWYDSDGEYHRENGPAVIWSDGLKDWYLHGKSLTEENFHIEIANKYKQNKEEKVMSKSNESVKKSFGEMFMQDAANAAVRSGATAGINALKTGLNKAFESQGMNKNQVKSVMMFLNTPLGEGLLRSCLGHGLTYLPIPMVQDNAYAQSLAEELRVSGLSKGMDKGMELVQQFVVPSLLEAFKNTPLMQASEGARIAERVTEAEEEEEEVVEPKKKSRAA